MKDGNINAIEKSLFNFIDDDSRKVAALKGEWGIGKTFFWNTYKKKNQAKLKDKFKAYSYVSLFGAQEISDLKKGVISNIQMLDDQKISKHLEKFKPISKVIKNIDLPWINASSGLNDIAEHWILDNFLICIDDLERKEKSISISSILGLISWLKEEKNCKIILIYNDEKIDDVTQNELNEFREKVIDLDLTYKPTIENNLSIIWPNGYSSSVLKVFKSQNLNNIRIMQRVKWTQDYFESYISKNNPHLSEAFHHKSAILTMIYYHLSNEYAIEKVVNIKDEFSIFLNSDTEGKKILQLNSSLGYLPDAYDLIIVDYLQNGYVDFTSYEKILQHDEEDKRIRKIKSEYWEVRNTYSSNFATTQEDFIKENIDFLNKHLTDLELPAVVSSIHFLQELDETLDLEHQLDRAIENTVSKLDYSSIEHLWLMQLPSGISERIREKINKKSYGYSISESFKMLIGNDSWNHQNLAYLERFTEAEFYEWMLTEQDLKLLKHLRDFFAIFGNPHYKEKYNCIETLASALKKVKERSVFDRIRIENVVKPT